MSGFTGLSHIVQTIMLM